MVQAPSPSERDRREASIVTGQRSGHQFEIQLGHLCNNRCVFCSSGHLTALGLARPLELQPILDTLDEAYASGASRLVFLGGEPTLHKGFLPALEHASKLGFGEIVIFTNGVRLPQDGFIDACVALGDFTWRISIQGANEEAHVAVTKKPRSFQRIVRGIEMLRERGQRVTTNMCVTAASYRSLPDYPELVQSHGIRQLHIDIVRPESSGVQTEEYLREIMPRYSDMAPYYDRMLAGFDAWDPSFDVNVGNLPYCVLPQWAHRIHHAGENTVTRSAGLTEFQPDVDKYAVHRSLRTHITACETCVFRDRCTGVFKKYLALYGEDEFTPVSREALRELDPEMNSFTVLVGPDVAPLFDTAPPAPWRLVTSFADARSRRFEVQFERAGGGRATLHVSPPEGVGAPVGAPPAFAQAPGFRLSIASEGWYPAGDLVALAAWVTDRVAPDATPDLDTIIAARGEDPTLARGRARLARLVRALRERGRFDGWRYAGADTDADGRGAVVRIDGPEGFGIRVAFRIAAENGRSKVDASLSLTDETDPRTAGPVAAEIAETLRTVEQRAARR